MCVCVENRREQIQRLLYISFVYFFFLLLLLLLCTQAAIKSDDYAFNDSECMANLNIIIEPARQPINGSERASANEPQTSDLPTTTTTRLPSTPPSFMHICT